MTKVKINPGVCGFVTSVEAEVPDKHKRYQVKVTVKSGCKAVQKMADEVCREPLNAFEICTSKPGRGPLYDFAKENFPGHSSCTVIAGIAKAAEVACGLGLKGESSITFEE